MAEQSPHPTTGHESPPRMPRWVTATLIIVGVVLALFVISKLTGAGGEHGPARHMSAPGTPAGVSQALSSAPPASAG